MSYKLEMHMNIEQIDPVTSIRVSSESADRVGAVDAIKIEPSSKTTFATGSHDRTIKLWDINKMKCLKTSEADSKGIWCLDYHPSGKELLSASSSGVCKLWDSKTGKATSKLTAHKGNAFWAAYSESGDQMVTCGSDKLIYLWSRKNTKSPVMKLIGNKDMVKSVAFFNNDKNIISTSLRGEITIYNSKTGDIVSQQVCLGEKDEYEGNISYCVTPLRKLGGGLNVMTTHEDCVARMWEFNDELNELHNTNTLIGHSDTVRYADFSPSEKRCVTACEDHSFRVWDMKTGEGMYLLAGHTDICVAADFLDEKTLISASWDQTIKLWRLPS